MGSKYKHVFEPIRIRGVDFKNRITLAPPSPNLASEDGLVTKDFVNFFRMFARGGVCTLFVGNCSIDITECKDEAYQLNLISDRSILPLTWYADMCREYGCHASLEINHNGENSAPEDVGADNRFSSSPFVSATELARAGRLGRAPIPCIEMSYGKIEETIEKYAKAALRMKRAGMDIVLVHGGHGNLIAQFTSPLYNKRTDKYGGSTEKRALFAIEVCKAIREKCGEDFVIEMRISGDEIAEGGMHIDETIEMLGYIKPYIDIAHVSAGIHSDFEMKYYRNWCQNFMMERGFNVHFAEKIKKAHPDLLVNTVGSIVSLDLAEEIISGGKADFVAMMRPLLADPDMPRKYANNMPEERRPCLRCDACTGHLFIPKPQFCAINPMVFMCRDLVDGRVPKAPVKKKVAVVGGGPAGITALTTLVDRGHDVTLYEKTGKLGGNVIGAAAPTFKIDCQDYLKWLELQVERSPARVLLNTEATKDLLEKENYDALIIAIGAEPVMPALPGIDKPHVSWAPNAEMSKIPVGDKVIIVGAGSVGLEAAIEFSRAGKDVMVIELLSQTAAMAALFKSAKMAAREFPMILEAENVPIHYELNITEILDDKVICRDTSNGRIVEFPADTVLIAVGMKPLRDAAESMRRCAPETEVRIVGDAAEVGSICTAVNSAFAAALHI
jgi:2,4-dienoyl-CoA reductase-like NADH-dependent reductase (Old Yellow Enzyme family)/NADPH-dependent 2,4-dienoyl-CoA reductase/sulfur reductase-like enzyme